jgi:hypothetical protein
MAKKTKSDGGVNTPRPRARGTPPDSFVLEAIRGVQSRLALGVGAQLHPQADPPPDHIITDDGFDDGETPVYHREPPGNQP